MIATESIPAQTAACTKRRNAYLRALNGNHAHQLFALPTGRTTIGRSVRCTLHVPEPSVEPLHCLIINDSQGLTARSWVAETFLNGHPFVEMQLAAGDVLAVGELEFEIVSGDEIAKQPAYQPSGFMEPDASLAGDRAPTEGMGKSSIQALANESEVPGSATGAMVPAGAAAEVFRQLQSANEVARGRSRKLISALRSHRDGYQNLTARIDDLEQALRDALSEREFAVSGLHPSARHAAEYEASLDRLEEVPNAEFRVPTIDEWSGIVESNGRCGEEIAQLADAQRRIIDELVALSDETTGISNRFDDIEFRLTECSGQLAILRQGFDAREGRRDPLPEEISASMEDGIAEPSHEAASEPQTVSGKTVPRSSLLQALEAGELNNELVEHIGGASSDAAVESASLDANFADRSPDPTPDSEEFRSWASGTEKEPSSNVEAAEIIGNEFSNGHAAEPEIDSANDPEPEREPVVESVAPPSFIERYAHLFDGEEAAIESSTALEAPSEGDDKAWRPATSLGRTFVPEPLDKQGREDEEESIEAYMARLLQRVRGESVCGDNGSLSLSDDSNSGGSLARASAAMDQRSIDESANEPSLAPLRNLQEMKRREPMPDHSTDIEALRALANESARRAIGTHASRTHRRAALTKVIVALLAGMTSLLLMLQAPGWTDPQFIVACISLTVAAYWAGQSYGAVVKSIRAGSYDGPESRDREHSLPIDVEHRL